MYTIRSESRSVDIIPPEDVDFIRAMVALPKESKILARGIILGLGLMEQVVPASGPFADTGQDSA